VVVFSLRAADIKSGCWFCGPARRGQCIVGFDFV
jgi:hypothetical protein